MFAIYASHGVAEPKDDELAKWQERARKVVVGMQRSEVDRLLPKVISPSHPVTSGWQTGSQSGEQYFIASNHKVSIVYDHTGGRSAATNRVLTAPRVEYVPRTVKPENEKK